MPPLGMARALAVLALLAAVLPTAVVTAPGKKAGWTTTGVGTATPSVTAL